MTADRDPRTMSRDELVAYFDGGGDNSELLLDAVPARRWARRRPRSR
jgi:hypothetical protein